MHPYSIIININVAWLGLAWWHTHTHTSSTVYSVWVRWKKKTLTFLLRMDDYGWIFVSKVSTTIIIAVNSESERLGNTYSYTWKKERERERHAHFFAVLVVLVLLL